MSAQEGRFSRLRLELLAAAVLATGLAGCSFSGSSILQKEEVRTGTQIAGAIEAPPGSNQDFILNVGRRVFFTQDSSELSPDARVTLDKQADWLSRYAAYKIKIEGFADDPGSAERNSQLGLKRAEAARAYLASRGIAEARMRVKTFGNQRDRKTEIPAQNRRVTIVLDTEVEG